MNPGFNDPGSPTQKKKRYDGKWENLPETTTAFNFVGFPRTEKILITIPKLSNEFKKPCGDIHLCADPV